MTHKRSTGLGGVTNLAVLAPIKAGMVVGFEPISYLERLRKVLDALQSARQNVRESELRPPVFPDAIGRFGLIQHFRYAIVPPVPGAAIQPDDGTWHLSLNVTFDGGWEPYMRVIYRDLGTLLDLLFCHCDGYPGSSTSTFEAYCDWVRSNEVEGGIFYADSPMSLGDQHYLAAVEQVQREHGGDQNQVDGKIARIAMPSTARQYLDAMKKALEEPRLALVLPLRTLKGLYRLSTYFPPGGEHDEMGTLRRFAQSILQGPMELMRDLDRRSPDPFAKEWAQTQLLFKDELAWLRKNDAANEPAQAPKITERTTLARTCLPETIQSHILARKERMTHGCVVLLRIHDADAACRKFTGLAPRCGPVPERGIGYLLAFTHAGLKQLRVAQHHLDVLPQEFVDGMEARCALLGDVRGNHPDHWVRPPVHGLADSKARIDLKAAHLLVHLRLRDDDADPKQFELHAKLAAEVEALGAADTGLHVMAVQATRTIPGSKNPNGGHFNLADGISQPQIPMGKEVGPVAVYSDLVSAGELLLGRRSDRGERANPPPDPLLADGSFLVVRRLRQHVDRLNKALAQVEEAQHDDLLSSMLGRRTDGTPLVALPKGAAGPNDFNYEGDGTGEACPFHSHIRRSNPRDPQRYTPRILRRGMSYGPKADDDPSSERGVVFMAYCASIAEQFETIQRWIAGGNSSGVGSSQGDPFLRVPQAGESSTFRYLDKEGRVARVIFDDKPLVQLEWGLYLFVPTVPVLKSLATFRIPLPAEVGKVEVSKEPTEKQKEEQKREQARQVLDDPGRAKAAWQRVRNAGPYAPQDTAYGRLIGGYREVLDAMKDDGSRYSVQGYGDRMGKSIGLNLLGMDPGPARTAQLPLNKAVADMGELEAFNETAKVVQGVLSKFPPLPALNPGDPVRCPIDLVSFSDAVMATLCATWIGLPDKPANGQGPFMVAGGRLEENTPPPRCPGNFATASRYIFSPHPRADVELAGKQQGEAVREAVRKWLDSSPQLGSLAQEIKAGLGNGASNDSFALSIAGVLLGFPPTVHGNFIRTMETWIETEALWQQHRQALFEAPAAAADDPAGYGPANAALRTALLSTMRQRPVPEMLWRSPRQKGEVNMDANERVVLGITSALTDDAAPDELMFGRDDRPGETPTVHGCPGYAMAMGVMLAMIAGLMKAGTLRPTGSPVLLILTPGS